VAAKYVAAPITKIRRGPETGTVIMSRSMISPSGIPASYPAAAMWPGFAPSGRVALQEVLV